MKHFALGLLALSTSTLNAMEAVKAVPAAKPAATPVAAPAVADAKAVEKVAQKPAAAPATPDAKADAAKAKSEAAPAKPAATPDPKAEASKAKSETPAAKEGKADEKTAGVAAKPAAKPEAPVAAPAKQDVKAEEKAASPDAKDAKPATDIKTAPIAVKAAAVMVANAAEQEKEAIAKRIKDDVQKIESLKTKEELEAYAEELKKRYDDKEKARAESAKNDAADLKALTLAIHDKGSRIGGGVCIIS